MKTITTFLYFLTVIVGSGFSNDPYSSLQTLLPFNDQGWYSNGPWIEKLFQYNRINSVLEVGSWLGKSTRHIASLLPENGKLVAVDTWEGSVEHKQSERWSKMLPSLYDQFLSNVVHSSLTHKIEPVRATSLNAALFLIDRPFDLIYIDASHDTESVLEDLEAYYPFIQTTNGILCGDDWNWESVRKAVEIFAQENNLTVYGDKNFWFLKQEKKYEVKSFLKKDNKLCWLFQDLNRKKTKKHI